VAVDFLSRLRNRFPEDRMKKDKWWQHVLWAVFCFALAAWLYYDLTKFEEVGGSRRMNAIVGLLYNILGKWGAVGSSCCSAASSRCWA
jgi:hypothetical protein